MNARRLLSFAIALLAASALLFACGSSPGEPAPKAAGPAAKTAQAAPQKADNARYVMPPSRHFHLPLPPDIELVDWQKGHDKSFVPTARGPLPPTDTDDTMIFGRRENGALTLVTLRYAHRLACEGTRLSAWLESTLAGYAQKPDYHLQTRDRTQWITAAPSNVRYQVLFTFTEKGATQNGHLELFMHGDTLMLFALVVPEADYRKQNPIFSTLMDALAYGPAPTP